jgi:hypothetical protein
MIYLIYDVHGLYHISQYFTNNFVYIFLDVYSSVYSSWPAFFKFQLVVFSMLWCMNCSKLLPSDVTFVVIIQSLY